MAGIGIHHVTAIAGKARGNRAFYAGVLGLRLIKRTVNFDDPGAFHLYYGDAEASPGSVITFFPWEHAAPGQLGTGEVQEIALRAPPAAMGFWQSRLAPHGAVEHTRFGETVLRLRDPDGLRLAVVPCPGVEREPAWQAEGIPPAFALRGLHGVSLLLADAAPTAAILSDVLGFATLGREGDTVRMRAVGARDSQVVDIEVSGQARAGRLGRGSVHHLAFRALDDTGQAAVAARLAEWHGIQASPQRDRAYFRSIYFREPGNVLFEVATDTPGFTVDEPLAALGQALQLPPFLEDQRDAILQRLPPLD
ncbi:ring-cleaving dioxygenase [Roseomonas haemaphysalidis]|uniref:Ring-cleaving dioxygenase n=1 Tax=Roseomonas haemaphysalidis TaxID=2768162 RepID=A0ABS3KPD3_9PROT|nr:ring-cleaving dioxygenase [Roseomonas haemaphysalidis]MBO1078815.1 ring-cleaving dioxygenase [Roseomonas haemaphysalidis]